MKKTATKKFPTKAAKPTAPAKAKQKVKMPVARPDMPLGATPEPQMMM